MSERVLSAAMLAAIAKRNLRPAIFYEGEFETAGVATYVRLVTAIGSLSWDGKTWLGGGDLLNISKIEESSDIKAVGFEVTLSGCDSARISLALQSMKKNRPGRLWLGLFEPQAYFSLDATSGNYASTPDASALDITGDIDLRARVAATDWTPSVSQFILGKSSTLGANRSYELRLETNGRPSLNLSANGTNIGKITATAAPSIADGAALWLRVTYDADTGSGSSATTFYTSSDGLTWTQLGSVVIGTTLAIKSGNAVLSVGGGPSIPVSNGANPFAGNVYYAEVRDGINGTIVAKFDPLRFSAGALTSVATTGETWTITRTAPSHAYIVNLGDVLLDSPYALRRGRFDIAIIDRDPKGGTCTITAKYEDRLIDLERPREWRYTSESQKALYPDVVDKGFDYVETLQDAQFIWGR